MAAAAHASNAAAAALFSAAATDLRFLARFHDREPEPDDLGALARHPARSWLAVTLDGTDAGTGFDLLDAARGDFAEPGAAEALSVDHADLYLTFARRLAPNESYWLTEDHLERQEPMFAVRAIYARRGLAAENWRRRADDHLVLELEFVAHLLEMGTPDALAEAGRFLDRHLMVWSGAFLGGVACRAATRFYTGLALVTQALLEALRGWLEIATGETASRLPLPAFDRPQSAPAPEAFVPGGGPGW